MAFLTPHFYDCDHILEAQKYDSNNKNRGKKSHADCLFNPAEPHVANQTRESHSARGAHRVQCERCECERVIV